MALTELDPKTALIVIDLQKGIVGYPTVHPIGEIIKNSRSLIDLFREYKLPVVLVTVDGVPPGRAEQSRRITEFPPGWTDLVAEMDQQPEDHLVTKKTWGAFTKTDLEEYLKGNGTTQVVIVGVATSAGVESTARQAHECGFNVALAVDAMTDMNADAHQNSVARIFPRLGETGTTQEVIDALKLTHKKGGA